MTLESETNSDAASKTRTLATVALIKTSDADDPGIATWKGKLNLPDWFGYVSHLTDECEPDEQQPLTEPINLQVITTESMPLDHLGKQSAALEQFVAQQATLQQKMLRAMWEVFVGCYSDAYADLLSESEENETDLTWEAIKQKSKNPSAADLAKLKALVGPRIVKLYSTDGKIPVQLCVEFGCWWDPEHGLEILVENGEIKDIDSATATDPAFWEIV